MSDKIKTTSEEREAKKALKLAQEKERVENMCVYEKEYEAFSYICGIDEAGRGPLASAFDKRRDNRIDARRNHRPDNYRERKGFRLHLCRTATIQSGGPKRQRDSLQNSNFKRMPGMEQRQNNPEFGYQGCTFRSYG